MVSVLGENDVSDRSMGTVLSILSSANTDVVSLYGRLEGREGVVLFVS